MTRFTLKIGGTWPRLVMPLLVLAALAASPAAQARDLAFTFSGETRARYESLDGQFRLGRSGSDQALFFRTLLHGQIHSGDVVFGIELQDSRSYLDDEGTPLTSSFVNPLDILQAYVDLPAPSLLSGDTANLILGRQTVSIGSKRQIERVSFANVIKSYTGAHYVARNAEGDEFHLVAVVPVRRLPRLPSEIRDNELALDEEEWNRQIWGVQYRNFNIAGDAVPGLWGEVFVYGLTEQDRDGFQTPNRQYATPGFRLYRAPVPGQIDLDIEGAWRFGRRRATSLPADTENLRVSATNLVAIMGYTFDMPWRPRIALEYFWSSGDEQPLDGRFDQYERLFGARRTDLNNTSLHGPLTPANLSAPGFRIEIEPSERSDARLVYSHASLASDTDSWVIARLRDPSGQSGDFLGHTIDTRARYQLVPGAVEVELGGSVFLPGEFPETAPLSPNPDRTLFGYAQITYSF